MPCLAVYCSSPRPTRITPLLPMHNLFLSLLLLLLPLPLLLLLGLPACLAQSLKNYTAVAAASHTVILSNTMASPSDDAATNNTWGPYASGKDFGVNMATVLVVLLCATALAFALHVAFRFLVHLLRQNLDRDRARAASPSGGEEDKPPAQLPGPVVSFSSGATRVAGAPECAICLAELAEGDRVRVLPPCSHGFHAQCVEAWLVGRSSCPTCRTDCRPPPEP